MYFTTGSDSAAGFFRGIVFMTSAEHVCEAEMKGETNSTAGNDVTAATNLHCNVDRLHKSHLPFQKNDDAYFVLLQNSYTCIDVSKAIATCQLAIFQNGSIFSSK